MSCSLGYKKTNQMTGNLAGIATANVCCVCVSMLLTGCLSDSKNHRTGLAQVSEIIGQNPYLFEAKCQRADLFTKIVSKFNNSFFAVIFYFRNNDIFW